MTRPVQPHPGLLVYQAPLATPDVQARYGYTDPVRCMSRRHRGSRPVAQWLVTLALGASSELHDLGFPLTVVQAFAACRECVALVDAGAVRAFPATEWKGAL